ncbi:MAG: FKBP-type peptidyl-prolyl cis-trans isomerase [Halococcoides sp.]
MTDENVAETDDSEPAEDVASDAESEDDVGLDDGDFVELEYTARTVEDDALVDTTSREVAEEEGVAEDDHDYGPQMIVIGQGHIFPSIEESLRGSEVGDEGTAVAPAHEAFGEYDDEQVRTVSADKIPEDDRYPGAQVTVDGEQGYLETIVGGRARVDFNHPLAGADIEYDYEISDVVEDREERAARFIETAVGMPLDVEFETETVEEEQIVDNPEDHVDDPDEIGDEPVTETVETEQETLYIEAIPQLAMNQQWMFQKQQIGQQLEDLIGVDRVVLREELGGPGPMGGMMGGMGGPQVEVGEDGEAELEIDADELAEELEE